MPSLAVPEKFILLELISTKADIPEPKLAENIEAPLVKDKLLVLSLIRPELPLLTATLLIKAGLLLEATSLIFTLLGRDRLPENSINFVAEILILPALPELKLSLVILAPPLAFNSSVLIFILPALPELPSIVLVKIELLSTPSGVIIASCKLIDIPLDNYITSITFSISN
ncbi:MAG: hypothetical protein HC930_16385 [Hydrococcus sp. SU_1_0]|nr:hypothetical protein [Hydrococcus sp. SU_1_0]